jgi:ribonuclease HI
MTEHSDREVLRGLAETLDIAETCSRLGLSRTELRQCLERAAESHAHEFMPAPEMGGALTFNIDGAARGNPGPAGAGVVVWRGEKVFEEFCKYLGRATNNQAEYQALILALEQALELGAREVTVRSDSELLVKQMLGEYRVKNPELKVLFQKAAALRRRFDGFRIQHVPREQNAEADRMANRAIDEFAPG